MERKLLYDIAICVCCILYVKSFIKVLTVYWNKQIKKKLSCSSVQWDKRQIIQKLRGGLLRVARSRFAWSHLGMPGPGFEPARLGYGDSFYWATYSTTLHAFFHLWPPPILQLETFKIQLRSLWNKELRNFWTFDIEKLYNLGNFHRYTVFNNKIVGRPEKKQIICINVL